MAHQFAEIAFTPSVRRLQTEEGSRTGYMAFDEGPAFNHRLTERERGFIAARDSFYMASVGESGWPYIQHRGGPVGFMKVLDEGRLGFADYAGNRQYISRGNFRDNDRVSLFFMDYANRRRLKLLGRIEEVTAAEALGDFHDSHYLAEVERGYIITVSGFDWNCPQHITPRFSETEVRALLESTPQPTVDSSPSHAAAKQQPPLDEEAGLGDGPLSLVVTAMRQLTPRVRAYELRSALGEALPPVTPGSNLRIPIRLPDGTQVDRQYSISSDPAQQQCYEIAVLREEHGSASRALHASLQLGTRLNADLPTNQFALHEDARPALLIAGGIGITPLRAMAYALRERGTAYSLHFAARNEKELAYGDGVRIEHGERVHIHLSAAGNRLELEELLRAAPDDALIYVCGPPRLIRAVTATATALGIQSGRVRFESFA